MEWLKDALVARHRREIAQQWERAGEALADLLRDEAALEALPPEAVWTVLNSVQAGARGVERALREARRVDGPAAARRALGEVAYALGGVIDVLEKYALPEAERRYGLPPAGTRWRMEPADKGGPGR